MSVVGTRVCPSLEALPPGALRGETELSYRVAIVFLAVGLIGVAALYGALLAFLLWLVVWHAVQTVATWPYGPYFVYHVPMAVLSALLLTFLVKPLFVRRRGKAMGVVELTREEEPQFFEFVDRLCELTEARRPTRIEVDADANASAGARDLVGLLRGQMVLRVGLPLVAGLSLRQLAGVLAHELGHFRQRQGLFASQLIRRLNGFFSRIVFERDALDGLLVKLGGRRPGTFRRGLFYVLWLPVEAARGVLWVVLLVAEALSCWALRRMEHDADLVEASLVGSKEFARTGRAIVKLMVACRSASNDLSQMFIEKRLPDDLPSLVAHRATRASEREAELVASIEERPTRWRDTHPSHADRLAKVLESGAQGCMPKGGSGGGLFRDFPALCRRVTRRYYEGALESHLEGASLVTTGSAVKDLAAEERASDALQAYLRRLHTWLRPVMPGVEAELPVEDIGAAAERLLELRRQILEADESPQLTNTWIGLQGQRAELEGRKVLGRAVLGMSAARRINQSWSRDEGPLEEEIVRAEGRLSGLWRLAEERLTLGLRLAHTPGVLGESEAMELISAGPALFDLCRSLQAHAPRIVGLRESQVKLDVLISACGERVHPRVVGAVLAATERARDSLSDLKLTLGQTRYPFAHGRTSTTVGAELVPELPPEENPGATFRAADLAAGRAERLVTRAVARLARFAEAAELAVGLEPLPAPPEPVASDRMLERQKQLAALERKRERSYWLSYSGRALGGVAMLGCLVGLSLAPPTLPRMPWDDSRGASGYQPAAFHTQVSSYAAAPLVVYGVSVGGDVPAVRGPIQYGGRADPRQPGYAPGHGMLPPGAPSPYAPPTAPTQRPPLGSPGPGARPSPAQPGPVRPGPAQPGPGQPGSGQPGPNMRPSVPRPPTISPPGGPQPGGGGVGGGGGGGGHGPGHR
jgi:Zn-dependent protease with chaperone function